MYKEGKFTDVQAASIIAKYGVSNYKDTNGKSYYKVGRAIIPTEKINVTDGQAFRSLSSMRAVLDMSGEWTDEMRSCYNLDINRMIEQKSFSVDRIDDYSITSSDFFPFIKLFLRGVLHGNRYLPKREALLYELDTLQH